MKKEVPGFVQSCATKGLVYQIPHTATQVGGIVGGNGLYKASAFGPTDGSLPSTSEEAKRKGVEARLTELAERGGWHANIDKSDESLPVWQRRGFDWTWQENGDLEVIHRVPGKIQKKKKKKAPKWLRTGQPNLDVRQAFASIQLRRSRQFSM